MADPEIILGEWLEIPIGSHQGKFIYMASNRFGYKFKEAVKEHLRQRHHILDFGSSFPDEKDCSRFFEHLCQFVSREYAQGNFSSVGLGFCANSIHLQKYACRYPNLIAEEGLTTEQAISARKERNANILCIGAHEISLEGAIEVVEVWLKTEYGLEEDLD